MKPLNVPIVRQEKDSVDCGIAAVNMITKFWKLPFTFEQIQKNLEADKFGTYCPQLGSFLIKNGFKVTVTTFNPGLFTLNEIGASQDKIKNHLEKISNTKSKAIAGYGIKTSNDKRAVKFFLQFMKDGGVVEVKIPTEEDIREELKSKNPSIVVLTSSFLFAKNPRFNFHFNVVTGIDRKFVYVNDPLWDERGGKHKYKISDFLFGMYAGAGGGVDNPSLIRIRK